MADRTVTIKFIGETRDAEGKIKGLETKVGGLDTKLGTLATTAAGFVLAKGITSAPGFLLDGAKAAAEGEAKMAGLRTAVENTGKSYGDYETTIDGLIKKGQDLAFSDDDVATALDTLISLTGDTEEGMSRLGLAQDLARGTGMDLVTAAKLLGKTSDENTSALARYGIKLDENATAQDVMNAVDAKFGGRAASFAETDAAKIAKMTDKFGELQEQMGTFLLPIMALVVSAAGLLVGGFSALLTAIEPVTSFIGDNIVPIFIALAPLLAGAAVVIGGALVTAFIAWAQATWLQVAAMLGLNASMLPIIAVLVAVGAAIALLYLAWDSNFMGIRDITMQVIDWMMPYLQSAWDTIKAAVDTVLGAIRTAWETVFPILQTVVETVFPIIQRVIQFYVDAWSLIITTALDVIKGGFETVFPIIQTVVETVFPIIETVVRTYIGLIVAAIETGIGVIEAIWGPLWNGVQAAVDTVMPLVSSAVELGVAAVQLAIETVIGAINLIWGPFWDGFKLIVDNIFNLADGVVGLVDTGVAAVETVITDAKQGIIDAWNAIWDPVKEAIGAVKTYVSGIVQDIIDIVNGVIGKVNGAIGRINSALEFNVSIPGVDMPGPVPDIPGVDFSVNAPDIPSIPLIPGGGGSGGGGGGSFNAMSAASGTASPSTNTALAALSSGAPNPLNSLPHNTGGNFNAGGVPGGRGMAGMRLIQMWVAESDVADLVNGAMTLQGKLRPV